MPTLFRNTFHPLSWYINFAIAKLGTTKHTFNSNANEKNWNSLVLLIIYNDPLNSIWSSSNTWCDFDLTIKRVLVFQVLGKNHYSFVVVPFNFKWSIWKWLFFIFFHFQSPIIISQNTEKPTWKKLRKLFAPMFFVHNKKWSEDLQWVILSIFFKLHSSRGLLLKKKNMKCIERFECKSDAF